MKKIKFKQKILVKISSGLFLGTAVILLTVGLYSFHSIGKILRAFNMRSGLEAVQHTMNKIDRLMYNRYNDILSIAGEDSLKHYLIDFKSENGRAEIQKKDNVERLQELTLVSGPWDSLFIIDGNGVIALSDIEKKMEESILKEPLNKIAYIAAMEGKIYVSDFAVSDDSGLPTIVFAAPIKNHQDPAKPTIGVVIGNLSWMVVEQILDDFSTGNAALLDHSGNIIANNAGYVKGGTLLNEFQRKAIMRTIKLKGSQSTVFYSKQGIFPEDTLVSMATQEGYLSYKGFDWSLVLSQPASVVFAPTNNSVMRIIFVLLIFILLLTALSMLTVQNIIIKPLDRLLGKIQKISKGDLTQQVEVISNDEIGQLVETFNEMTSRLQESYAGLEDKVQQRTNELQASEKKTNEILENSPHPMVIVNKKRIIIRINSQTEKLFGYERKELIGKPVEILMPERFRSKHVEHQAHYFSKPVVRPMGTGLELFGMSKDGHDIPVEISLSPFKQGDEFFIISNIIDITERKKMEDEIKRTNQELVKKEKDLRKAYTELKESSEELKLMQAQLFQNEKLAAIGQLASGVAHEINNPLGFISNNMEVLKDYLSGYSKILGVTDGLKKNFEDGDVEKASATINELKKLEEELNFEYIRNDVNTLLNQSSQGIERIKKIILDLRIFSRQDKGDTRELVKIEDVIDSILTIVQSEIKYKAEVIKEYADCVSVSCNPQKLGQVAINLLINASQAMTVRGKIIIKTYRDNGWVCVDFTDTGQGIPEENLKEIFKPFFTTKPAGMGTGLGLSVCHEIIAQHGGEITVKSKVGEGTTFTVKLPIA